MRQSGSYRASQPVVGANSGESVRGGRTRFGGRHRIDEIVRRAIPFGRLDDEELLVGVADEQPILQKRSEDVASARVTGGDYPLRNRLFVEKARFAQLGKGSRQRVVGGLRGQRRVRDRRCQKESEQQPPQPLPARRFPHL